MYKKTITEKSNHKHSLAKNHVGTTSIFAPFAQQFFTHNQQFNIYGLSKKQK